jgi:hypothetical protein
MMTACNAPRSTSVNGAGIPSRLARANSSLLPLTRLDWRESRKCPIEFAEWFRPDDHCGNMEFPVCLDAANEKGGGTR